MKRDYKFWNELRRIKERSKNNKCDDECNKKKEKGKIE